MDDSAPRMAEAVPASPLSQPIASASSTGSSWRRFGILLARLGLMLAVTLVTLELAARIVWWGRPSVTLAGRTIELLPAPLLTPAQRATLDAWAEHPEAYIAYDPVLGWNIRPNAEQGSGTARKISNGIGIRSLHAYARAAPPGVTRLAAFGPSFTHGDEVNNGETWTAVIERDRPDLEAMNWGVGAYGTDQAYLRYLDQGRAYHPDIVLIGYEEDGLNRNTNRFVPFYNPFGPPLPKPIFLPPDPDTGGDLERLDIPFKDYADYYAEITGAPERVLDRLCPHDLWCDDRRYRRHTLDAFYSFRLLRTLLAGPVRRPAQPDPDGGRVALSARLIEQFARSVRADGAIPVLLMFPMLHETITVEEQSGRTNYSDVLDAVRGHGGAGDEGEDKLAIIDLAKAFVQAKQRGEVADYRALFAQPDGRGHYSVLGNRIVAEAVLGRLVEAGIVPADRP